MDCYLESEKPLPIPWMSLLALVSDEKRKSNDRIILLLNKVFPTSLILNEDYDHILIECYVHDLRFEKEDEKQYLYALLLKLNHSNLRFNSARLGIGDDGFIKIHQEISLNNDPYLDMTKVIFLLKKKAIELKKVINMLSIGE